MTLLTTFLTGTMDLHWVDRVSMGATLSIGMVEAMGAMDTGLLGPGAEALVGGEEDAPSHLRRTSCHRRWLAWLPRRSI